jgi:membrane protein involved in colicin uptake
MALSNAERQRRWRARRDALAKQLPSELTRRLRDLDKRRLSAGERARLAEELSELAAAYRRYAAAVMRVVRGLRS